MKKTHCTLILILAAGLLLSACAPVTLDSRPSGATVYDASGQAVLGTTPYDTHILINDKNFVLKKDRFKDQAVQLPFDAEEKMVVTLQAKPILLSSVPPADIYFGDADSAAGRTPLKVAVQQKARQVTLKADGYYDKTIPLSTETPDPFVVNLDRRPIVEIRTSPAGVEVRENGTVLGTAPLSAEIEESRTFEFSKEGYFTKTVTLKGAPPYRVDVELDAYPEISVQTKPVDAQISLDGKPLGTAPVSLKVGRPLSITANADRYYEKTVQLTPESDRDVTVELEAMPYVTVQSDPADAEITADGKSLGTAPVEILVEKPMTVQAAKDGYQPAEVTLSPDSDETVIALDPQPAVTQPPMAE